jgi:hypothetical protein
MRGDKVDYCCQFKPAIKMIISPPVRTRKKISLFAGL